MSDRRSYGRLSSLPAYGLYKDGKLVASIRAGDAPTARDLFRKHKLTGDRVKRLPP